MVDIKKLFQGIAVIIDDEIYDTKSQIYRIKQFIESEHIPVLCYDDIPDTNMIPSISNASFIILDWEYSNKFNPEDTNTGERLQIPSEYSKEQKDTILKFLEELTKEYVIPTFIFTHKDTGEIKRVLEEADLSSESSRIFVKEKQLLESGDILFSTLKEWIQENPSAYVIKEWDRCIKECKHAMFLELYIQSPQWVSIIWEMLKNDSLEYEYEFGEFLTRSLKNRITEYHFDDAFLTSTDRSKIAPEDIAKVLEGERYIAYKSPDMPSQAYTGDLFRQKGNTFFLNIGALCDLARPKDGQYNPNIYYIEGRVLHSEKIAKDYIKLDENYLIIDGNKYLLNDLASLTEERRQEINKDLSSYRDKVWLRKGTFIEQSNKVIIGCIAGNLVMEFNLNIKIDKFNNIRDKRIGRILPPYITKIQQKCAQFLIREGILPVPQDLFIESQ